MPRFVARPVVIEAHQWSGNAVLMPDDFRLSLTPQPDGSALVQTIGGGRRALHGDWVMRGSDGSFSVVRGGAFDDLFEPLTPNPTLDLAPVSAPLPVSVKRPYVRRNIPDAQLSR